MCRQRGALETAVRARTEEKAEVLLFGVYGKQVIDQRRLSARTRIEYEAKWSQLIEPRFAKVPVADMTSTAVRAWFTSLDATKERRNSHAYGILSMIFARTNITHDSKRWFCWPVGAVCESVK